MEGSRKWQPLRRNDRPHVVLRTTQQQSNTSYLIKHVKTKKEEIVHFNRLKRAHADTDTLNNYLDNIYDDTNTYPQIQDTDDNINIQSED